MKKGQSIPRKKRSWQKLSMRQTSGIRGKQLVVEQSWSRTGEGEAIIEGTVRDEVKDTSTNLTKLH